MAAPSYALIAEPDPTRAALYRRLVLEEGLDPVLTRDGEVARRTLLSRGAPSLLITNLSLTRLDGFGLLAELRTLAAADAAPVIAVSPFVELRTAAWNLRAPLGISEIVATNAPAGAVRRAVNRALGGGVIRGDTEEMEPPASAMTKREQDRLAHIIALGLAGDPPPDAQLQELARETAEAFHVPTALVSIALEDRQRFHASVGLGGHWAEQGGWPRDWSFCRHVVDSGEPLVVPDALSHPFFAGNPLVTDGTIRSYAGAPLTTPEGHVLGTLCIIDRKPSTIGVDAVDALVLRARRAAGHADLGGAPRDGTKGAPDGASSSRVAFSYLEAVTANLESDILLLDPGRRILFVNRRFSEAVGLGGEEALGMPRDTFVRLHAARFDDPESFLRKTQIGPAGPVAAREEFEVQRPERRWYRWVAKPVPLPEGTGQLEIYTDITAEMALASERERLALTDALTGLANRRGGEETVSREVARARRASSALSFALFDVDHFKRVNDTLGHAAGDRALRAIGRVLASSVRGADLAARWGGEEFLAVLPDTGEEGARLVAERVRAAVEALLPKGVGRITVSAGIAELAQGEDPQQAIARADARLYEAKKAGRNQVR